tara:strand:- start:271 stop:687 length:417 start_codon:yes stop_codon:yes gene_type:complete
MKFWKIKKLKKQMRKRYDTIFGENNWEIKDFREFKERVAHEYTGATSTTFFNVYTDYKIKILSEEDCPQHLNDEDMDWIVSTIKPYEFDVLKKNKSKIIEEINKLDLLSIIERWKKQKRPLTEFEKNINFMDKLLDNK